MKADKYCFNGNKAVDITALPHDSRKDNVSKDDILKKFDDNLKAMAKLHDKFAADGREGIIFIFQAIDAAGKDSTIKHVVHGFNPAGVFVYSYKVPTALELKHDYLWRFNLNLPKRGEIAIFNRSYYEDVLAVQIHDLWKTYQMPERNLQEPKEKFFRQRYRQICDYEEYLYENGFRVVKFFLNVSKEEQKERFMERIDIPEKNWKFSAADLRERALWDQYQSLFNEVISETASEHSPWYVIPADQKWYTRYLVSEVMLDTLHKCKSQYPEMSKDAKEELEECKAILIGEKNVSDIDDTQDNI